MPRQSSPYPTVPMPAAPDPMQSLSGLMALGRNIEGFQESQREANEEKAYRDAMAASQGDLDAAAKHLEGQGQWELGRKVRANSDAIRRNYVDQAVQRIGQNKTLIGRGAAVLQELKQRPDLYPQLRSQLVDIAASIDPTWAEAVPTEYDETAVGQMVEFANATVGTLDARARALATAKQSLETKATAVAAADLHRKTVGEWFSVSDSQEDWDASIQAARTIGVPKEVVDLVGPTWSKDAQEAARKLALTPAQAGAETRAAVDDKRMADSAVEQKRHNQVMESLTRQRDARLSKNDAKGLSDEARATAERWKAGQLAALEEEYANPQSGLSGNTTKLRERQLQVENGYRAQLGLTPLVTLPKEWSVTDTPQKAGGEPAPPAPAAPKKAAAPVDWNRLNETLKDKPPGRYKVNGQWYVRRPDGQITAETE